MLTWRDNLAAVVCNACEEIVSTDQRYYEESITGLSHTCNTDTLYYRTDSAWKCLCGTLVKLAYLKSSGKLSSFSCPICNVKVAGYKNLSDLHQKVIAKHPHLTKEII